MCYCFLEKVRHVELFRHNSSSARHRFGVVFLCFWVIVMSEKKYEQVKKFLSINRGDNLPDGIVVLQKGDYAFSATHANYQQAKLDLQYRAKQVGANALLDVYVSYYQNYGTTYTAHGVPAVIARNFGKRTLTAAQLTESFKVPPPPPPPPAPVQITYSGEPWFFTFLRIFLFFAACLFIVFIYTIIAS